MLCRLRFARRASVIVHYRQPRRRPYSSKAPFSRIEQKSLEAPPSSPRQRGVNVQKAQHQIVSAELSEVPISCQQQQALSRCDDQEENCLQWPGQDAPVPLGKTHSFGEISVSKTSRQQKTRCRKQKGDREGHIGEYPKTHPVSVADGDIGAKLSASRNGSSKLGDLEEATCSNGNANTFGMGACMQSAIKGRSTQDLECATCSQASGVAPGYKSKVCSSPLEDLLKTELLRKVKVIERFAPGQVASILTKRTFKCCSFEQLETVLQVLEEYFLSRETAFKSVVMNPGVLLYPADLLQQKLQVFEVFQIEKKIVGKLFSSWSVLTLSVESLQQKFAFLDEELGLNAQAKNRIFLWDAFAFAFTIENVRKTLELLRGMGATDKQISRLIENYPHILKASCDNLIPKYRFFQQIGISALKLPRCICCASRTSLDTLKVRMQSIKALGFSDADACSIVNNTPEILKRKTQTLKTKVDYLVNEQKRDYAEIAKCPGCLLRSLHGWIIPRCRRVERAGLSKVVSLSSIMCYSSLRFENLLKKRML